ncbi:ARHGAP20 [Lepeophtheirus salmonis]|uniref:ARHGAP20 n=1 Tax=Lepeophtheirus salmonis TaxID=72036 RepID=A0A7R8CQV3_LEPSM|nr:ARHGAP20 [Lepeophtheirus salmonis]CAF2898978.1 ARHGAP20 [Lepeophtheirus salmonis]
MSSWGEKMTSVVTACGTTHGIPYARRLEKVKFGVPLDQVCKKDIPGPLLVMLLKLNKEGPFKRDVFRAPGHQGNMRKLVHFLQQGRLVNIHTFSVNTIASVLKKFLRKIPGGIFGPENEKELFTIIRMENTEAKLERVHQLLLDLPIYSQHLLVLLFGTFRVIHSNSVKAQTGMSAEALGVSDCIDECLEKLLLATKVTTFFIEHFGIRNLFGRDNYEYYAKLTGRILKVEDEWIFFTYPPVILGGSRDDMDPSLNRIPSDDEGCGGENCPLDPQGRLSISLDDHQQNVSSPSSCGSPLEPLHNLNTIASPISGRNTIPGRSEFKSYTCLPQVHERQTERMKHRSEWFLSDPSGLVTVKCRPGPLALPLQLCLLQLVGESATKDRLLYRGKSKLEKCFSYQFNNTPSSVQSAPWTIKGTSLQQLSGEIGGVPASSSPPSSAPPTTTSSIQNPQVTNVSTGSSSCNLRRRLSDKERRLVRRSSSKRKDKENGGGPSLKRAGSADSGSGGGSRLYE